MSILFHPGLYNYVSEGKGATKMCDIQKNYKCQTSICEERENTAARDASDENIRRERTTYEDSFQSYVLL